MFQSRPLWMISLVLAVAAAAPAVLPDVKVTTDTSIDCSSIDAIARDLYRDCKSDQDKAIATWYFVRRLEFHWPHIPTHDSIDLINSYGFALCGYQSPMFCEILRAGGIKARTLHLPNHVIAEAFYDDAWHLFDCQVGWFAYRKDGKVVASAQEIAADPTIGTQAAQEGRGSQPYFQCGDNPSASATYAKAAQPGGSPEVPTNRLIINLHRGESITRIWGNEGKGYAPEGETKFTQPSHNCQGQKIDADDPVNWPFWKPYAARVTNASGKEVWGCKRAYGNGKMVYEPDLAGKAWTDAVAPESLSGVSLKADDGKGANVHPAAANQDDSIILKLDYPYVAADAWLDLTGLCKAEGDSLVVSARSDAKQPWKEIYRAKPGEPFKAEAVSLKDVVYNTHGLWLKVDMRTAGDTANVGLDSLRLTTVIWNNIYSLPYFKPGKNVITVAADAAADLKANPLTLEYVWRESGSDADKTLTKTIDTLPCKIDVEVGGAEMPKMKSVRLSVAP
jgi:transglutaminase-like putative cysteine protease